MLIYKFLSKYGQVVAFGVGVLITVVYLVSVFGGLDQFNALTKEDKGSTSIFDMGLYLTVALLILCAFAAITFGLYQMVTNPKGAIKGIIGLVALGAIFAVLYSMADPETSGRVGRAVERFNVGEGQSRFISAIIKSTLLLGMLAAVSFVGSEIRNFFK